VVVPSAVAVALLAALASAPHAAASSNTYVGESDQGFPVRAFLRDGAIDRIRVKWAAPCHAPGYVWGPQATMWFNRMPAPFSVTGQRFSDHGTIKFPFRGGRGVMTQRLSGRFSTLALSGTQSTTVRVYRKDGKLQDSCSSKVRFKAAPSVPMAQLPAPLG
jgi:hypothetical protein